MSLVVDNKAAAIAYRDEVADYLDALADTAADATFDALQGVRAALVRDVNDRLANLPAIVEYIPLQSAPAVVLAHELLGDARLDNEIIKRNPVIEHEGFIHSGKPIEYLKECCNLK